MCTEEGPGLRRAVPRPRASAPRLMPHARPALCFSSIRPERRATRARTRSLFVPLHSKLYFCCGEYSGAACCLLRADIAACCLLRTIAGSFAYLDDFDNLTDLADPASPDDFDNSTSFADFTVQVARMTKLADRINCYI